MTGASLELAPHCSNQYNPIYRNNDRTFVLRLRKTDYIVGCTDTEACFCCAVPVMGGPTSKRRTQSILNTHCTAVAPPPNANTASKPRTYPGAPAEIGHCVKRT